MNKYICCIIIGILLFTTGGCSRFKKDTIPAKVQPYVTTNGDYVSGTSTIKFYRIEERDTNQIIKLKKINIEDDNTIYSVILAIKSTEPTSVTGMWDGLKRNYISYRYEDKDIQGIEILFEDREGIVVLDLNRYPMYVMFEGLYTYKFGVSKDVWEKARDYMLYD